MQKYIKKIIYNVLITGGIYMDKIVHFEIPVDNLERAQQFYKKFFGWNIVKTEMPNMEYHIIHTVETDKKGMPKSSGAINGGMMKRMKKGETPVLVIKVKSLDDTLKKLKQVGIKIVMPKMQVGNMGLYARFLDPEGNVMGIWQDLPKK